MQEGFRWWKITSVIRLTLFSLHLHWILSCINWVTAAVTLTSFGWNNNKRANSEWVAGNRALFLLQKAELLWVRVKVRQELHCDSGSPLISSPAWRESFSHPQLLTHTTNSNKGAKGDIISTRKWKWCWIRHTRFQMSKRRKVRTNAKGISGGVQRKGSKSERQQLATKSGLANLSKEFSKMAELIHDQCDSFG